MNPDIFEQLKALKRIAPHPAYTARARAALIAATTPHPNIGLWHALRWAGALTFALVLLFFVATFSIPARPTLSASLNEELLTGELDKLPINIELRELSYRVATEGAVQSAMREIEKTEAAHLNAEVLSSELSSLETENQQNKVDALLETMLE
ncbi:MAG: hypothetical protein HYU81_02040 [Candidatus Brennerbacteria bacterium]|nr:hypothetical protein [Candidatus Brennerbacteria bacterium]